VRATQWPNQFPFSCKNSTQNAPKVVFLSSKIEIIFWGGGTAPSPDSSPSGEGDTPFPHPTLSAPSAPRSSRLRPSTLGPPALPVSPPDLGVLAEILLPTAVSNCYWIIRQTRNSSGDEKRT